MRLQVIQSGELLAEEPVASAEQAYQRGREIVLALREGRPDYREGSA